MNGHVLKNYDQELNKLRYRLVRMGSLVQQQIEMSVSSILNSNIELAKQVMELEEKVDKLDLKIDKQCIRIIALHQPVARDLRLILAALQIDIYFEIIGDYTTEMIDDVAKTVFTTEIINKTKIKEMSEHVIKMIGKVLDSFVDENVNLALDILKIEEIVNILFKDNFNNLLSLMKADSSNIDSYAILLDVNRLLDLISKSAKTIAQELIYLYEPSISKHNDIEDLSIHDIFAEKTNE